MILRPNQLAARLGVHVATLWRMEKQGLLPARIQLGARAVGWRESEIIDWMKGLQPSDVTAKKSEMP